MISMNVSRRTIGQKMTRKRSIIIDDNITMSSPLSSGSESPATDSSAIESPAIESPTIESSNRSAGPTAITEDIILTLIKDAMESGQYLSFCQDNVSFTVNHPVQRSPNDELFIRSAIHQHALSHGYKGFDFLTRIRSIASIAEAYVSLCWLGYSINFPPTVVRPLRPLRFLRSQDVGHLLARLVQRLKIYFDTRWGMMDITMFSAYLP